MADSTLVDLKVNVDGKEVALKVSPAIYEKAVVENDQATIDLIYKSIEQSSANSVGLSEEEQPEAADDNEEAEIENDSQPDAPNNDCTIGYGSTKWSQEGILLLLSLYHENRDKFANSAFKNKNIWRDIATQMREKGLLFTGECCDKKFRMMKHRHKVITDNNSKSGRGTSRWEWFDHMEELLAGDPAVKPVRLVSSAVNESTITSKPPLPVLKRRACTPPARLPTPPARLPTPPACQPTPPARQPTPPICIQSDSPRQMSSSPDAALDTPVVRKRRRSSSQDTPEWFVAYSTEQTRRFELLQQSNDKMVAVAEERNTLIKQLITALMNKD